MTQQHDTSEEIFKSLEAELDVDLIEWEPASKGERIVGIVKAIEYVPTKSGEAMGVLTLTTPSGALARVACGAKNLRGQLESAKVQPGDGLAIQYEGKRQGKNGGNEFNAYRVAMQAIGQRDKEAAFKVPEMPSDLGLVEGATDPWSTQQDGPGF